MPSRRTFASRLARGDYGGPGSTVSTFSASDLAALITALPAASAVVATDTFPMQSGAIAYQAAASTILTYISGAITTAPLLTTIGTLVAGAVPASLVTAGTFGAGNYATAGTLAVAAGAADDALVVTSTFNGYQAKFRYDASNLFEIGVTATGNTTLRSVGTSPSVNFIAGAAGTASLNFLTGTLSYFTGTAAVVYESTNANQVQVKYDASNYLQLGVSAAGAVTFNAVGSSAGFAFSDSVNFTAQQSLNFVIENRTSDPGSPAVGQLWLRTDL